MKIKENFEKISQDLFTQLEGCEVLALSLSGENSDYIRWNQSKIRQWTQVEQFKIQFELQTKDKSIKGTKTFTLDGSGKDVQLAVDFLKNLRQQLSQLASDPYFVPLVSNEKSEKDFSGGENMITEMVSDIAQSAVNVDLAGLLCSGFQVRAVKNSLGQNHWFSTDSFFMDYSLYEGERASKSCYAGSKWQKTAWRENLFKASQALEKTKGERLAIKPGAYRVYLAPDAVNELLGTLSWGGFSAQALQTSSSPLMRFYKKELELSPLLTVRENFSLGGAPAFNDLGEVTPEIVPLIENGKPAQLLTSTRTAKEFHLESNQASSFEIPRSLEILPGTLKQEDVLKQLDEGLYLSQLHYLNWSDQMSARVTGMTRYACFQVKNGEVVGPIQDLRFDQSLYEALGKNLLGVTEFRERLPLVDTYFERAVGGKRLPGLLIDQWNFVL